MNYEIKEIRREAAFNIVGTYIEMGVPFSLMIWNKNDWSKPLPPNLINEPSFMIDFKNWALENSFISDDGDIILSAAFDETPFNKILEPDDILFVLDAEQKPIIINNFPIDDIESKNDEIIDKNNVENLEDCVDYEKRSYNAFKNNNSHFNF